MHSSSKPQDCGHVKTEPLSDAAFRAIFREVVYGGAPEHQMLDELGKLLLLCLIERDDRLTPLVDTLRRCHMMMGSAPGAH
jgi:hypothetical protein